MGVWGPGIYQNDIAEDVRVTYMELIQTGKTPTEAYYALLSLLNTEEEDEALPFWLAIADTMWECGHLPDVVKERALCYLENNTEIARWSVEAPQLVESRIKVLYELREKLLSPQPPVQVYHRPKLYTCKWKLGDLYEYPIVGAKAFEIGLSGCSLLFHKVGVATIYPGHVVPVVRLKLVRSDNVPQCVEEFDRLPYLRIGRSDHYRLTLRNTSAKVIPKTIRYIGNFPSIEEIPNEFVPSCDVEYESFVWKRFDDFVLPRIVKHNVICL